MIMKGGRVARDVAATDDVAVDDDVGAKKNMETSSGTVMATSSGELAVVTPDGLAAKLTRHVDARCLVPGTWHGTALPVLRPHLHAIHLSVT
jgi:hypothetical protein